MNAKSVLDRLRNVARRDGREFQATLLLYAQERLLARLAVSAYREHFALKGGVYLYSRYRAAACPTQDMDFAGRNTSNDPQALLGIVREIAGLSLDDGVTYDLETLTAVPIAEGGEYTGVRVRLEARIGQARLRVTLDIGFGDAIPTSAAPANLSDAAGDRGDHRADRDTGNRDRREVSGDGRARSAEHAAQGFLRPAPHRLH